MRGTTRSYPPPGDAAARYDAVLRRGRSLRRRRNLARGAGTGGAVLATVLALVLVAPGGGEVDRPTAVDPTPPKFMSVDTVTDEDGRTMTVVVVDPAFPVDERARQCVSVEFTPVDGPPRAVARTRDCTGQDPTDEPLTAVDRASISCSTVLERDDPAATTTSVPADPVPERLERGEFTIELPPEVLPPGEYEVMTRAASGIGDGCANPVPGEDETYRSLLEELRLP